MKNLKIYLFTLALGLSSLSFSQLVDPGDGGGGVGGAPGPVGGGAPVGSGLISLTILATAYGLFKVRHFVYDSERSLL